MTKRLTIEVARARRGYIEPRDVGNPPETPAFRMLRGLTEETVSSDGLSRSVINETLAAGETVMAVSAITDPRFQDRCNVRAQRLEADANHDSRAAPTTTDYLFTFTLKIKPNT